MKSLVFRMTANPKFTNYCWEYGECAAVASSDRSSMRRNNLERGSATVKDISSISKNDREAVYKLFKKYEILFDG